MSIKEIIINFNISLISIILGVVVTFAIQGRIDKVQDRKEVNYALDLVSSELAKNIEDINTMSEYLNQEIKSANYLLDHRQNLAKCPVDSINYHSGIIFADASITLSHDALELLKMSSLFQKIGNSPLSMKIIRAYDACEFIVANMNKHIDSRNEQFESTINERTVKQFAMDGIIDIGNFLKTDYGLYSIKWLTQYALPSSYIDTTDIQEGIDAIEEFRHPSRKHKKRQ